MTNANTAIPLPGAIAVTHLQVYDSTAPDGLVGGTPHMHTLCTEGYFVLSGAGRVQTLCSQGFAETPLFKGQLVWFQPGVIHRLVNDGALELLVMMQNAGLPEAGDMVITFPTDVVSDPAAYARAHALPEGQRTDVSDGSAARARRDLGVQGFMALRQAVQTHGIGALHHFYEHAARVVNGKLKDWRELVAQGPAALVAQADQALVALNNGDTQHLRNAALADSPGKQGARLMGCCGTLAPYP